jgi:hypothetical protein
MIVVFMKNLIGIATNASALTERGPLNTMESNGINALVDMSYRDNLSGLRIVYGYKAAGIARYALAGVHARILGQIGEAKALAVIDSFEVREHSETYEKEAEEADLLRQVRELAMRCKIKVRFGSRRYPYEWFPLQFLLVYRGGQLCQAFPCMLEGGCVQPEDFLERLLAGEAWTVGARRKSRRRDHDRIVEYLMANPDVLEPGLTLLGAEHPVSDASGETGFLDLLFRDRENRHLIVEVKVKASQVDEGIGKLGRHRRLFAGMNHMEPSRVRRLLACPDIPEARFQELREASIEWRIVPLP